MRPETFKTKTETRKNGLETKSPDFITVKIPTMLSNQKSFKCIDLEKLLSRTIFHGFPYA